MKDIRLDHQERQAPSGRSWDWMGSGDGREREDPRGADARCGWVASLGTVCGVCGVGDAKAVDIVGVARGNSTST